MNIVDAMKRSKETGETFKRTDPKHCPDIVISWAHVPHTLGSHDLIADDWEAVPIKRTAEHFVSWDGRILVSAKAEAMALLEDAKRIADAPDGKVADLAKAFENQSEADRLAWSEQSTTLCLPPKPAPVEVPPGAEWDDTSDYITGSLTRVPTRDRLALELAVAPACIGQTHFQKEGEAKCVCGKMVLVNTNGCVLCGSAREAGHSCCRNCEAMHSPSSRPFSLPDANGDE